MYLSSQQLASGRELAEPPNWKPRILAIVASAIIAEDRDQDPPGFPGRSRSFAGGRVLLRPQMDPRAAEHPSVPFPPPFALDAYPLNLVMHSMRQRVALATELAGSVDDRVRRHVQYMGIEPVDPAQARRTTPSASRSRRTRFTPCRDAPRS